MTEAITAKILPVTIIAPTAVEIPTSLNMEVETLTITTPEQANYAAGILKSIADFEKQIEAKFEEPVSLAHRMHKSLTKMRGEFLSPLATMKNVVKSKLLVYQQEEERKQKEEQARLEAEAAKARKIEEARLAKEKQDAEDERNRQIAIAQEAEASGDMVAANEAHLAVQSATETIMETQAEAQAIQFAPPVMAPVTTKIAGVSTGTRWTFEVQNLMELVKAVAAGTVPITYLEANEKAIRGVVTALKENAVIPGVRVWSESSIRTR